MIRSISFALFFSIVLIQCNNKSEHHHHDNDNGHQHGHNHANDHMNQADFSDLVKRFESAERDAYQQPEKVLAIMGDIQGQKIMEIGAGTGYFSFRLADAGASVIAADVDDRFQNFIKEKKQKLNIPDEKVVLRKVPYDSPELSKEEVDQVLIVNTYHHIEDRSKYFRKVKEGLKDNGQLVVVDFFKKETPVGPPVEMKLKETVVMAELEKAGFSDFEIIDDILEYQYIIIAK